MNSVRPIRATLYTQDGAVMPISDRDGTPPEESVLIRSVVEFGRQNEREPHIPPGTRVWERDHPRYVIADITKTVISRTHVLVEPTSSGAVKLTNRSRGPITLEGRPALREGEEREFVLPVMLGIGDLRLRLRYADDEESSVVSLDDSSFVLGRDLDLARSYAATALSRAEGGTLDNESLVKWVQAILGVLQGAAGTLDFFPRAARAVVDLIRLDSGRVLVREAERWVVRALQTAGPARSSEEWQPSRVIIQRVLQEKRTCFLAAAGVVNPEASLREVSAVVAAPIFDRQGDVVGILYGERRSGPLAKKSISRLEVLLVELLASGIAVGMARVRQEEQTVATRTRMEQFFTPEMARRLVENPNLLQGQDMEVSMLSCDIRGFSRICERLQPTPARTLEWLNDVLGELSACVMKEDGVLVDYVGDELMNMWGAPDPQIDHARRACKAGLAMLEKVPQLNARWQTTTQEPMGVRIGINSGVARVGNVGSELKFKYGALGNTINLTARVQGAAKHFRTPLIITQATQKQLDSSFATRRLAQVRVMNIAEPVTLYELTLPGQAGFAELKGAYEDALAAFEKQEFRRAALLLGGLLAQERYADDGPALVLMQRVINNLAERPKTFLTVWELPSK